MQVVADALEAARHQSNKTEFPSGQAKSAGGDFELFLHTAIENGELGEKIRALFARYAAGVVKGEKRLAAADAEAAEGALKAGGREVEEAAADGNEAPKGEREAKSAGGKETERRDAGKIVQHAFGRLDLVHGLSKEAAVSGEEVASEESAGKAARDKDKSGRSGRIVEREVPDGSALLAADPKNEPGRTGAAFFAEVSREKGANDAGPSGESTAQGPKSASRPKLVVVDLRAGSSPQPKQEAAAYPGLHAQKSEPRRELRTEETVRFFSRALSGERTGVEGGRESVASSAKPEGPRFQQILRNEVVRHSTIILKEGGGELRLILKPESLGRVRINLSLNNDHIAGRIIVENSSVKEMFESNLQHLQNAFKSEGYASASLDVSVGAGGEQARGEREPMEPSRRPPWEAAAEFESSVPVVQQLPGEDWIVNLTV